MSFTQRLIGVSFQLGNGTFVESGTNTVALPSLRSRARISKAGTPGMSRLDLEIFGMTLSLMNQISTLGMIVQLQQIQRNIVTVTAGDASSGMGTAFIGTITNAYADFRAMPDVAFRVEAHTGLIEAVAPAQPTSFQGSADVATIMASIAKQMGLAFENNGVNVKINNPYFPGSARDQAQRLADAADIEWNIVDESGALTLAIWPKGGVRTSGLIPLISPSTGLVGYPDFVAQGIRVRALYNPTIGFGQKIQIAGSQIPQANGTWAVYSLDHDLASIAPDGPWFSTLGLYAPNLPAPVLH